ncbi:hypothetical protein SODALDRAFT_328109 [Sodiomyces alkalinus F11]|uniref:Uncharacterized protein n=1 Tax=Sodiomyces alkalinus (strain CBS 110278 / VKM F-3762 / F11) TaxID=1314773 RepID=A0A3N2PMT5_SODAK|nr:hypothetical protein SODALDRAFT_328109 [Sodiomyces alkalinus F11]ROT35724.1 hypothetical protein SODALDRAFT_328109 [Sodiomyces alkalinus F11]
MNYTSRFGIRWDARELWDTLRRHKRSLKRFIFQARTVDSDVESETFEAVMDTGDMGILSPTFLSNLSEFGADYEDGGDDEWFNYSFPNPLNELDLECVGLACHPDRLQEVLTPFASKACLRILHIRQSGPDIKRFGSWVFDTVEADAGLYACFAPGKHAIYEADGFSWADLPSLNNTVILPVLDRSFLDFMTWLFGPRGVPSLEILAYGDFSCHGRYLADSFMLRRKQSTDSQRSWEWHDPTRGRHPNIEGLLEQHAGFLEACPTDTIMHC